MITTNTARTDLQVNGEPLPWADWAIEFRENLPDEIEELVRDKSAETSSTDHTKSIRDRLKDILDLFRVSRYKPAISGASFIDDERVLRAPRTSESGGRAGTTGGGGRNIASPVNDDLSNIYAIFEKKDGVRGRRTTPDPFPKTIWVCRSDGTREYGDIEDRAACFLVDQNLLKINADFRVFRDMVERFVSQLENDGARPLVEDAVRQGSNRPSWKL